MSAQTTWWVAATDAGAADGTSEANASSNLTAIVSGATNGDTVNIVGTYTQTTLISTGRALNYVGISNGTLDGTSGTAGFMQLNTTGNVSFTDLTFQNFTKSGPGAVIQTAQNAQVTITNCTFSNNTNSNKGGAINSFSGDFTITGCTFTSNTSSGGDGGGAISVSGAADFTITNTTFTSNQYTGTADGGGALLFKGTGTINITGSTFTSNTSNDNGGSIATNQPVTITSSTFTSNTSTTSGGGLFVGGGTITLSDLLFNGNDANQGGAVYSNTGVAFSNSTLVNNTGTNRGGAIVTAGTSTDAMTFTNLTFYNNSTANTFAAWGGAIRAEGSGARTQTYTNCLMYDNFANSGVSPEASDLWASDAQTIIMNNCVVSNGPGLSITAGDTNNGSTFSADLSGSSVAFVSPNVTYSAPASISDTTPIDFGTDGEDVGAWDSNINIFKGITDSDWATASNWSGTVPTATDNVTLLSDSPALVIGATTGAVANDLSVDAGSSLNITSGGSLILSGSSTGNITYNLNIADENWHLVSAPVSGEQYDTSWADANSIATGTGSNRGVSWYDNGTPDVTTGYWKYFTGTSGTFGQGVGYSLKSTGATTYSFTGTYTNGDLSPAIIMGAGTSWNLIGNSFSSYIDIATFLTNNTANIDDSFNAVYVWNGSSYQMLTSGKLHPGQAFFVNSKVNGIASIAESLQSHETGTSLLKSVNNYPTINLMISNNEENYNTEINYLEGKTKGLDTRFDLGMFNGVPSNLNIYTQLISEDKGVAFAKQALPNSDLETMVVPVGINAIAGKEITIDANITNLPSGLKVYLEDRENNTFVDLSEGNQFKTTLTADLNGIGRFYLHTKASNVLSTEGIELNDISIYKTNNSTLRITGLTQGKSNVKLFNILGKQVLNTSFTSNGVSDINLPSLATGIYVVQLSTENGMLSKKITLE